jgi:hypothetical protein
LDVKVDKAVKDPTCEEQGVTTYTATYTGKDELGGRLIFLKRSRRFRMHLVMTLPVIW